MNKHLSIGLFLYFSTAQAEPTWNNATEQRKKESLESAQLYINQAGRGFECGGIEMFDLGAVMDMPIYFADAKSRKILCIASGMAGNTSADPNENEKCPPSAWVKKGCVEKSVEIYRAQREQMNAK